MTTILTAVILIGASAGHFLGIICAYKWDAWIQKCKADREAILRKAQRAEYDKLCAAEALKPTIINTGAISRRIDIESML